MWDDSRQSCLISYRWTFSFLIYSISVKTPRANLQPWVIHYKCRTEYAKRELLSSFHTDKGAFLQYMTDGLIIIHYCQNPSASRFVRGAPNRTNNNLRSVFSRDEVLTPERFIHNSELSYYHDGCNPFIRETISKFFFFFGIINGIWMMMWWLYMCEQPSL